MIKTGDAKLPLDRVPALAKALNVDAKHLFRLALDQHYPEVARVAHEIFGRGVSDNKMILVQKFRELVGDDDPRPSSMLLDLLECAIKVTGVHESCG